MARAVHDVEWRLLPNQALTAVRSFDWRRLPNLDSLDLRRAAVSMAVVLVVVLSAAWTMRALASARAGRVAAAPATAAAPAPVIKGLAPAQKVRAREDVQPVAFAGQHFVEGMSLTIWTPDGLVATYGSESATNVTPAGFTLRARFDVPGAYHLVVRTPGGARSNEVTFVVQP